MASDDRPKLPRNPDEKLYVEGEKEPYFRDLEHTIALRVRKLTPAATGQITAIRPRQRSLPNS